MLLVLLPVRLDVCRYAKIRKLKQIRNYYFKD